MKKDKVSGALNTVFGWGIYIVLIAGGLAFFAFLAAIIIGGESATSIAVFVHKQYFPVVIRVSSFIIIVGLINMYISNKHALSLTLDKKEADAEIASAKKLNV
ncbi:MAG: hypothetical protein ACOX7R_06975 [Acetivibrionales bacterium]|jgi:hypothetical protein